MSEYSALKLQKIALTILEENKMLIVFFRAVILYILIVISIRLMGKRQIGELQPSELVITLLLSNIATLPIEDMTIPMSMGIVPIFTLVCLDVILSHCSLKFRGLRKLICGSPKIVVSRGIIDQKQLKDLRFSADDLPKEGEMVYLYWHLEKGVVLPEKSMVDTDASRDIEGGGEDEE